MRISENIRYNQATRALANASARQAEAATRASTGLRVNAPSDDPAAAAELTRIAALKARTEEFRKTVASARGEAEVAEGALGEAADVFARANELALQGANGSLNAADRAGIADEIASLKQHLVGLANTKTANGYVFGGSRTDAAPFDASGTFSGNDEEHLVEVSPGVTLRVNASGERAFTVAGGTDVFGALTTLEAALRANDAAAVAAATTDIERSRDQLTAARGEAGLLMNRLDTTDSALTQTTTALASRKGAVGEVDPFTAYSDLTQLTQSLEQAINVARTTLNIGGQRF